MTSRDFCYWLQGYFDFDADRNPDQSVGPLSATQAETIRRHLALVFRYEIEPAVVDAEHQAELNGAQMLPATTPPAPVAAPSHVLPAHRRSR